MVMAAKTVPVAATGRGVTMTGTAVRTVHAGEMDPGATMMAMATKTDPAAGTVKDAQSNQDFAEVSVTMTATGTRMAHVPRAVTLTEMVTVIQMMLLVGIPGMEIMVMEIMVMGITAMEMETQTQVLGVMTTGVSSPTSWESIDHMAFTETHHSLVAIVTCGTN